MCWSTAYKKESKQHPNYGKSMGMKAPQWWSNVCHPSAHTSSTNLRPKIIDHTFQPFLKRNQAIPSELTPDLLHRFSSHEGYRIFGDVLPFFSMLRTNQAHLRSMGQHFPSPSIDPGLSAQWPWSRTIVGVITNSDDRVPDILSSFGLNVGHRRVGARQGAIAKADPTEDVSFVVLSYDVGFEKPDRRIYDAAMWMLEETLAADAQNGNVASSDEFQKLYVGDEVLKDAVGASEAGWNSILLDRDGRLESRFDDEHEELVTVREQLEDGQEVDLKVIRDLRSLRFWEAKERSPSPAPVVEVAAAASG